MLQILRITIIHLQIYNVYVLKSEKGTNERGNLLGRMENVNLWLKLYIRYIFIKYS